MLGKKDWYAECAICFKKFGRKKKYRALPASVPMIANPALCERCLISLRKAQARQAEKEAHK